MNGSSSFIVSERLRTLLKGKTVTVYLCNGLGERSELSYHFARFLKPLGVQLVSNQLGPEDVIHLDYRKYERLVLPNKAQILLVGAILPEGGIGMTLVDCDLRRPMLDLQFTNRRVNKKKHPVQRRARMLFLSFHSCAHQTLARAR